MRERRSGTAADEAGGVEHQHFNLDPEKPALWMAFIHQGMREYVASEVTQTEPSPDWKAKQDQAGG